MLPLPVIVMIVVIVISLGIFIYCIWKHFFSIKKENIKQSNSRVKKRRASTKSDESQTDIDLEMKAHSKRDKNDGKNAVSILKKGNRKRQPISGDSIEQKRINEEHSDVYRNKSKYGSDDDIYLDLEEESMRSYEILKKRRAFTSTPNSRLSRIHSFESKDLSLKSDNKSIDHKRGKEANQRTGLKTDGSETDQRFNRSPDRNYFEYRFAANPKLREYEEFEERSQLAVNCPEKDNSGTDSSDIISENFNFVGNEVSLKSFDPLIAEHIEKLDKTFDYLIVNRNK